jgi:D-beta-D-heptose 7-phosphate kinase/D-beta-D-heptose 1-phosphate adenosyltransferase
VATVGEDAAGALLRDTLTKAAVGHASLVTVSRCTTQKTRVLARSQQLLRVDEEEDVDLDEQSATLVLEAVRDAVAGADAVVLEDYNKGVLVPSVIRAAIDTASARQMPIVVDPKFRNFFSYRGATVFKPNRRELEAALGAAVDVDHPDAVPATLQRLGVEHILLTLGDRGMALFSGDGEVGRVRAGDTVTAYVASIMAAGGSVLEAAIVANIAAGIEVGKLGAVSVTAAEVLEFADRAAAGAAHEDG